jgi:protein-S-isoprenylcysteine O-methyltransferase
MAESTSTTANLSTTTSIPLQTLQHRQGWENATATAAAANGQLHVDSASPPPAIPANLAASFETALIAPGGKYPLSGISLRAFFLGVGLGVGSIVSAYLGCVVGSTLWRPTFFIAALSLFHFLEFFITAQYNTPLAHVDAFLLSSNGVAYNAAHTVAFLETTLTHGFGIYRDILPASVKPLVLLLGFTMIVVGQATRSVAMAEAGTNFNHTVQWKKAKGHELVTSGIYSVLRHPSYFGFFWWGLGTQVVLGNIVCFVVYLVVLWKFFSTRIQSKFFFHSSLL